MTLKPLTLAVATALYKIHLHLTRAADYSERQRLHQHLEAHYGQLEHCRMVREINAEFDRAEREAGVSQVDWHGTKS
jgi:primosomal protein N''